MLNSPTYKPQEPPGATTADFVLDSYIMHIKGTLCTHCHSEAKWSEVSEVRIHRQRNAVRRLVPAKTLYAGLSVAVIHIPATEIPICRECVGARALSPSQCKQRALDEESWRQTLKRKYAAPSAEPRIAERSPARSAPSLDQI
jgi:hypothetical protein